MNTSPSTLDIKKLGGNKKNDKSEAAEKIIYEQEPISWRGLKDELDPTMRQRIALLRIK